MGKNRAIKKDATLVQPFTYTQQALPIHKPIVQYIRQSTTKQLKRNKQSYELQDSDLRRNLLAMGWKDRDIIKIDADQGKSGTKRRDERTGLAQLYELIESGTVQECNEGACSVTQGQSSNRDQTRSGKP